MSVGDAVVVSERKNVRFLEYIAAATSAVVIVYSMLACPGSLPLTRMIVEGKGHGGERIAV